MSAFPVGRNGWEHLFADIWYSDAPLTQNTKGLGAIARSSLLLRLPQPRCPDRLSRLQYQKPGRAPTRLTRHQFREVSGMTGGLVSKAANGFQIILAFLLGDYLSVLCPLI